MSSDTTATRSQATNGGTAPGVEAAEHERQFREMLEFCPAALLVVDEDGRLLFHNARLREILVDRIQHLVPAFNGGDDFATWGLVIGIAEQDLWNVRPARSRGLLRLSVCRPDHPAPLLGIIGYELGEIGGQAGPSYLDRLM